MKNTYLSNEEKTVFFRIRTYFLKCISACLWEIPIFLKTKKNRSEIASSFPAVARLDLSHVSENKGFGTSALMQTSAYFQQYQKKHSAYLYLANSVNQRGGAKQIITIFLTLL